MAMVSRHFFTSESVTEGHPDKICDQLSDSIYDEMLKQDPESHAGIECFCTTGLVVVGGEARTKAYGHFGRQDPDFTWEKADKAEAIKKLASEYHD